jgi:hypothetical protein
MQLRAHLATRLPEYMIPASFVVLDELPLTRNGKLDRAVLADLKGSALTEGYVAPRTAEERVLCELVAQLLGLERVGLTDHFFHLGGHSLLATRLAAQIRTRLGRELPIRTIFDTPVLGELARELAALGAAAPETTPLHADPAAHYEPFPLTPVQEAYWLGRQNLVELGEVACHVYVELKLRTLDLERFARAWDAAILRHPMLRAVIAADGTQRILSEVPACRIEFTDHSHAPALDAEAAALVVREAMSRQLRSCEQWPLFEVRVTRVAAEDWRVHISLEAMILDGESNNLLMQELFDVYHGRRAVSPAAELSFRDYILHLQVPSRAREQAHAYWNERPRRPCRSRSILHAFPIRTSGAITAD